MSPDQTEIVVGNVYNKFQTGNPVARWFVSNYMRTFKSFLSRIQPTSILEVGCGEGFILDCIQDCIPSATTSALDISYEMVSLAKGRVDLACAVVGSAGHLPFPDNCFDLVVCVEVLEHLDNPVRAVEELARVASKNVLASVPNEPLWRLLNVARGAYLRRFGNTPGHYQHWRPNDFLTLISSNLKIAEVETPIPWTMVLSEHH